jgi:hypothetical protein
LIAICSLKGSPGVTTWTLALAASWPQPARVVVAECDPSGGSIATRFGLAATPGLASLTAAARRDRNPHLVWSHIQQLPGGLPVVCAPPGAAFTRAALSTLMDSRPDTVSVLRAATAAAGAVVVADCGRLDPDSPALTIAREADRVLLLARPLADELSHLAAGLAMVDLWSMQPNLVLVGPGHPASAVSRALGLPITAHVPHDPAGARALCGYPGARRGPRRSRLGRAAHAMARAVLTPTAPNAPLRRSAQGNPFERPADPNNAIRAALRSTTLAPPDGTTSRNEHQIEEER